MRVFGWQTLMRSESKFLPSREEEVGRGRLRAGPCTINQSLVHERFE